MITSRQLYRRAVWSMRGRVVIGICGIIFSWGMVKIRDCNKGSSPSDSMILASRIKRIILRVGPTDEDNFFSIGDSIEKKKAIDLLRQIDTTGLVIDEVSDTLGPSRFRIYPGNQYFVLSSLNHPEAYITTDVYDRIIYVSK